jgi:hypothetical protein
MKKQTFYIITGFIVFAALARLLPHAYNFTPLGAIALFGMAYFKDKKWALIIPIAALWASDLILNNVMYAAFYDGFAWFTGGFIYIYGAFAMIAVLGYYLFKKVTLPRVIGGAFGASVIFFIVSNFGVWLSSPMYPLTLEGLIACYTAAIPFFHNTLAGDLIYCGVLFGGFEYLKSRYPSLQPVEATV